LPLLTSASVRKPSDLKPAAHAFGQLLDMDQPCLSLPAAHFLLDEIFEWVAVANSLTLALAPSSRNMSPISLCKRSTNPLISLVLLPIQFDDVPPTLPLSPRLPVT
jgi:hypothetical protein